MDYSTKTAHDMCIMLNLSKEITTKVDFFATRIDWKEVEPFCKELVQPELAHSAFCKLEAILKPIEKDGFAMLSIQLATSAHTLELYNKYKYQKSVFFDTMGCFARFIRESHTKTGALLFDRGFWTYRQLSCTLFRLGTLEFECCALSDNNAHLLGLATGQSAISVHIPSDAVLTSDNLRKSYNMAAEHFILKEKSVPMYCNTWLLAPSLQILLDQDSGISIFASDYQIICKNDDDNSFYKWLFGVAPSYNTVDLPEKTSLLRRAKAYILAGGKIGSAFGRYLKESKR